MSPEPNPRYRRAAADYLGRPETDQEVIRLAHHAAKVADAAAVAWLRQITARKSGSEPCGARSGRASSL